MRLQLTTIISGGQTGADIGGLVGARRLGLGTGGTATKGYRTDAGPQPTILRGFGLVEHTSSAYAPRTAANVRNSDATVWFGHDSPGYRCTMRACHTYGKPKIENPVPQELRRWVLVNQFRILNCAGNRERTNPGLARRVARTIVEAFRVDR